MNTIIPLRNRREDDRRRLLRMHMHLERARRLALLDPARAIRYNERAMQLFEQLVHGTPEHGIDQSLDTEVEHP